MQLIAAGTWPGGWFGDEPTSDAWLDRVLADGSVQPQLPEIEGCLCGSLRQHHTVP